MAAVGAGRCYKKHQQWLSFSHKFLSLTYRSFTSTPTTRLSASPNTVRILEASPRECFKNIKQAVPMTARLEFIQRLLDAGLTNVATASFDSSLSIPQLLDGQDVFAQTLKLSAGRDVNLPVSVSDKTSLERSMRSKARDIMIFVPASESYSRKTAECSVEEGLRRMENVVTTALSQGMRVKGSALRA